MQTSSRAVSYKSRTASLLGFVVYFRTHPSTVSALPTPLRDEVSATVSAGLEILAPGNLSLEAFNSSFLQQGPTTAPKLLAAARVAIIAKQEPTVAEEYIFQLLNDEAHPTVSVRLSLSLSPRFVHLLFSAPLIQLAHLFADIQGRALLPPRWIPIWALFSSRRVPCRMRREIPALYHLQNRVGVCFDSEIAHVWDWRGSF